MSFFSRKPKEVPQEPAPVDNTPTVITGTLPCSETGCTATNAAHCEYLDRRQTACTTAWCPDHQVVIAGHCYCRRHANTLDAVGEIGVTSYGFGLLPDVSNRMPSLVRWVSNGLHDAIKAILEQHHVEDEQFKREHVHSVRGVDGDIRWEMSWQLFNQTGSTLRITTEVNEREPVMVNIRVANKLVLHETPPWIERKLAGQTPTPEEDQQLRTEFYNRILTAIEPAVIAERSANRRPPY